jgi:hypothetical protein
MFPPVRRAGHLRPHPGSWLRAFHDPAGRRFPGQLGQATATFERAVAMINDVGLLAEEVDAGSGEMIGNFPQAFSHIGLINAAWAISQARNVPSAVPR